MSEISRRKLLTTGLAAGTLGLAPVAAEAITVDGSVAGRCPHCQASLGFGETHLADCPNAGAVVLPDDNDIGSGLTTVSTKSSRSSTCATRCRTRAPGFCEKRVMR